MQGIVYHNINKENENYQYKHFVSDKNLVRQINFLKKKYSILNCKDLFNKKLNFKSTDVFLTFDDGLKNHFRIVLPILKKNKINAIFYISNLPIKNNKLLDVHKIHLLLGKYNSKQIFAYLKKIITKKMLLNETNTYAYKNLEDKYGEKNLKRVLNYDLKIEYKSDIISKIFNNFFFGISEKHISNKYYMDFKEIKQLVNDGMIIGSHTISHPVLTNCDESYWKKEIKESVDFCNNINNYNTFCYPYGVKGTYNSKIIKYLDYLGVSFSVVVKDSVVTKKIFLEKRQEIPRIDCSNFFK